MSPSGKAGPDSCKKTSLVRHSASPKKIFLIRNSLLILPGRDYEKPRRLPEVIPWTSRPSGTGPAFTAGTLGNQLPIFGEHLRNGPSACPAPTSSGRPGKANDCTLRFGYRKAVERDGPGRPFPLRRIRTLGANSGAGQGGR